MTALQIEAANRNPVDIWTGVVIVLDLLIVQPVRKS